MVDVQWFNPERQQPRVKGMQFKITRHRCLVSRDLYEILAGKGWRVGVTADKRGIIIQRSEIADVTVRQSKHDLPFGSLRLATYLLNDIGLPAGWHPVVRTSDGYRVEIDWQGQHPADVAARARIAGEGS